VTSQLFHHGKPADEFVECHEHISPVSSYLKVFGALVVLTALTYGVSYMNLGSASLLVAMIVAVAKATLVCMYFMHLRYDDKYHVFVFLSTLLFVGIFFSITMFDLTSRAKLNDEQDTFFQEQYDPAVGVPRTVRPGEPEPGAAGHGAEGKAPAAPAGEAKGH
jgi:caa(3)-type oxidase subunit IV